MAVSLTCQCARLRNRRRGVCGLPKARKCRVPGQDVSGMAPPSRMTRAQHSRIAVNASSIAALIFKNTCRHGGRSCPPSETAASDGLHLRMLTPASERMGAKAEIQIVGQRADGKECGVGSERTAGHVFHAEADLQILDAVFAVVAAPRIPLHRCLRIFV